MSLLLSEGENTHSSIKCVGSLNEHESFRLLLNAPLSYGNEEIFLFRGGVEVSLISHLKSTDGEKNIKKHGSFCRSFFFL